jgi:hypothetical protein
MIQIKAKKLDFDSDMLLNYIEAAVENATQNQLLCNNKVDSSDNNSIEDSLMESDDYDDSNKQYIAIKNKIKSYLTFGKQSDYNNNIKQFDEQMNANVDLVQSYFTFKFCSRTVIREFYSFFIKNGFTDIMFHTIINNSKNKCTDDGKRLLLSIDIEREKLETMIKSATNTEEIEITKSTINNNKEIDDNNKLNKETEKILSMQVLFTKYVVSETIQSILELLKHFKIVPVTSVIRNNNGNFGVDFLKSMPGA